MGRVDIAGRDAAGIGTGTAMWRLQAVYAEPKKTVTHLSQGFEVGSGWPRGNRVCGGGTGHDTRRGQWGFRQTEREREPANESTKSLDLHVPIFAGSYFELTNGINDRLVIEHADFLTLHATDHLSSAAILAHTRLPTDRLASRTVRVLSVNFLSPISSCAMVGRNSLWL